MYWLSIAVLASARGCSAAADRHAGLSVLLLFLLNDFCQTNRISKSTEPIFAKFSRLVLELRL